ncbi:uncharacterized protein KY384_003419 [Bacidia gigantensis]|uniref:uncharacterized protein n=1 Tax=Bacidia gigantensis TaxID=2732470 RepID=UPI001D0389A7|nr:uncharacterized protein KY384_003419 [Bacidia gigantensis]KAG8531783.1 hypothetical protein KY384_003419 [Bacidia gigantensis]
MPFIGCPSQTAPEGPQESGGSACNWQTGNTISNLSGTAVTPDNKTIAPADIDPDLYGDYMNSTASDDDKAKCMNPAAHQLNMCWEVLNVTGYITDWVAFNQKQCDDETMGFADCFLYIELGGGANCSSFTGRSQCPAPDIHAYAGKKHGPQAFYVAFNIWNLQNWFFTYYLAITAANGLTSDNIAAICKLLNLPLPKPFPLLEILSVMAFALGLISPSGYGALIPALGEAARRNLFTQIEVPGEYLLRGVQQAPTLARNLLATGDTSETQVQISNIGAGLAQIVSQLQTNVQNAIIGVMGNFTLFMAFASDGFFSTQIQNLNTITQNVTMALQTYVVSQALQDDSVIITRAVDTDVHALATNGSELTYDIGCTQGYDSWGICDNWWYDSDANISYNLENTKSTGVNYTEALEKVFAQGITTPQMLFQGSQVCADAAGGTQGNAPGTGLSTDVGVWNAECVSNMKICTWETVAFSQQMEYTDCDHEWDFALEECGDGEDLPQARMPYGYLGSWLTSGEYEGNVCN